MAIASSNKSYTGPSEGSLNFKNSSSRGKKKNYSEYSTATGGSNSKKTTGKRKSASLPSETVEYLKAWMMSPEHIAHPYPTEQEKVEIMNDTGIELKQLTNWFVNNRKRYWKPRVEARLQQQAQAAQAAVQAHAAAVVAVSVACGGSTAAIAKSREFATAASTATAVKTAARTVNIVSPNLKRYKSSIKPSVNTRANNHPVMLDVTKSNGDIVTTSGTTLQNEPFATPLTFAAQMIEEQQQEQAQSEAAAVSTTSMLSGTNSSASVSGANQLPMPVASVSVSVSEGEMSDSCIDDSSSFSLSSSESITSLSVCHKIPTKNYPANIESPTSDPEEASEANLNTRSVSFNSLELFRSDNIISQDLKTRSEFLPHSPSSSFPNSSIDKKRMLVVCEDGLPVVGSATENSVTYLPSRKRFRTVSIDMWIDACQNASHLNDERLPSLEEASRLFGYTK